MAVTTLFDRVVRRAYSYTHKPHFATPDVQIGENVSFGRNVVFNCKRIRIGDGCVFGDDIHIECETFEIGDYATIYQGCFFPGPGELRIGHNFWIGSNSIVDAKGGTVIGNNVGIGAHSQLWTHMVFGDVMAGCRFHSAKPLEVGDDVWFVGHCLVSPIKAGPRSLAMLGSLVTKDMKSDHCYAGAPAKDITENIGPQFQPTTIEQRLEYMRTKLNEFKERHGMILDKIQVVASAAECTTVSKGMTVFNVADRTYTKRGGKMEYGLMRFLLPDAKFVPVVPIL